MARPKGIPHSSEYKKNKSDSMKNEKNHFFGKKHTNKTKEKMKDSWKHRNKKEIIERMKVFMEKKWGDPKFKEKMIKKLLINNVNTRITKESRKNIVLPNKDSSIEVKIQNFLKELGIEFFTHQYMNQIKHSYQCDILIPSMNLVIECDGNFMHCNPAKYSPDFVRFPNKKSDFPAYVIWEKDNIRTKELIDKGFKVLRLWESEIKELSLENFRDKIEVYSNE